MKTMTCALFHWHMRFEIHAEQNRLCTEYWSQELLTNNLNLQTVSYRKVAYARTNGLGWDITAYPWGGVSVG